MCPRCKRDFSLSIHKPAGTWHTAAQVCGLGDVAEPESQDLHGRRRTEVAID